MSELVFVDSNIFLYALDTADRNKQALAKSWRTALWKSHRGRVSFQVLQEFYVKAAQKWPSKLETARAEVRDLLAWHPIVINAVVLETAWRLQDRYHLSFWDSLIASAAKACSCSYLLTEDLQSDQNLDGVIVVNPFLHDPDSLPPPRHGVN